jgi:hypothetical protein
MMCLQPSGAVLLSITRYFACLAVMYTILHVFLLGAEVRMVMFHLACPSSAPSEAVKALGLNLADFFLG